MIVIECGKLADAFTDLTSGYAAAVVWKAPELTFRVDMLRAVVSSASRI